MNPDLYIKNEVKDIQNNIRNTIQFVEITKKGRGTSETYQVKTMQGGIYKDDLELFIEKAKKAIALNSGKLVEIYAEQRNKEAKKNIENLENSIKTNSFWKKLFGKNKQ